MPLFVVCCARCPALRHPVAVVAWHLSVCLGCGRLRASLACLVASRGAPCLVRFGRSRCLGRISPPRGLAPLAILGGCAAHAEAGREAGSLCLPLAPAKAGALGLLRFVPVRGPAMGLSLAGPTSVGSQAAWAAGVGVCGPSGVPCHLARGALGLGVFLYPPPPPFFFFFPVLFSFFFLFFFFLLFPGPLIFFPPLCAPVVSGVSCVLARGALGLWVLLSPPAPPPLFFSFLPVCFVFFSRPCRAASVVRAWFVCPGL